MHFLQTKCNHGFQVIITVSLTTMIQFQLGHTKVLDTSMLVMKYGSRLRLMTICIDLAFTLMGRQRIMIVCYQWVLTYSSVLLIQLTWDFLLQVNVLKINHQTPYQAVLTQLNTCWLNLLTVLKSTVTIIPSNEWISISLYSFYIIKILYLQ